MDLRNFSSISSEFRDAEETLRDQWDGEDPPATVLAAAYGRASLVASTEDRLKSFHMAEEILAQATSDPSMADCIATGFLEAIGNRVAEDPKLLQLILLAMPERCAAYLRSYLEL